MGADRERKNGDGGAEMKAGKAVIHGAYQALSLQKLDGRTRQARALRQIEAELATSLGGEPSPQQVLIIQRASVKAIRCALAEVAILAGTASDRLSEDWLRWSRELRADLLALGLERRTRTVTDLKSYVEEHYGE